MLWYDGLAVPMTVAFQKILMFERREINGILLGDNGYPLRSYLITPVLTPNAREERRLNLALCNTRVKIENVFGILKRKDLHDYDINFVLNFKQTLRLLQLVACYITQQETCQFLYQMKMTVMRLTRFLYLCYKTIREEGHSTQISLEISDKQK